MIPGRSRPRCFRTRGTRRRPRMRMLLFEIWMDLRDLPRFRPPRPPRARRRGCPPPAWASSSGPGRRCRTARRRCSTPSAYPRRLRRRRRRSCRRSPSRCPVSPGRAGWRVCARGAAGRTRIPTRLLRSSSSRRRERAALGPPGSEYPDRRALMVGTCHGVERQRRGPLLGIGDLGGDGGTGRTEEGADRGVDLAVGGLEEELGLGGIHAAGHLAELGDLVVHGCRHVGREHVGEWICVPRRDSAK